MEKKKILIVDDVPMNVKLLESILSIAGYETIPAYSGEEALRIIDESLPDLVLADVMMPVMDGFEMCRRIKENGKTRGIPVVMVTALNERKHKMEAMEAGADDFLGKPVDKIDLLVRVRAMLRIKSYQDELVKINKELLEKNERLEKLQKIKEGLFQMIIHDIKNPLSAIMGNLELMGWMGKKVPEQFDEKIKICLNLCGDIEKLIESVLNIYRMDQGKFDLHLEPSSLDNLVRDQTKKFAARALSKGITLKHRLDPAVPEIFMDRDIIRRVIGNLLDNAVRYTPPGGEIVLGTKRENQKVCCWVKDSGEGLLPEHYQKVFEMFEQVKLRKEGIKMGMSGLGLAFCKLAVEAHGWEIFVESEGLGKGCTFGFTIPSSLFTKPIHS